MEQTKPNELEQYRDTASDVMTGSLPRETKYDVYVAGPGVKKTIVATVLGEYHAMYVRDRVRDEHGHAGISFGIEKRNS